MHLEKQKTNKTKKLKNTILLKSMHRDKTMAKRERRAPVLLETTREIHMSFNVIELNQFLRCNISHCIVTISVFHCLTVGGYWHIPLSTLQKSTMLFVVWIEVNPGCNREKKKIKGRLFLEELGEALVMPLVQRCQLFPDFYQIHERHTGARTKLYNLIRQKTQTEEQHTLEKDICTKYAIHLCKAHEKTADIFNYVFKYSMHHIFIIIYAAY